MCFGFFFFLHGDVSNTIVAWTSEANKNFHLVLSLVAFECCYYVLFFFSSLSLSCYSLRVERGSRVTMQRSTPNKRAYPTELRGRDAFGLPWLAATTAAAAAAVRNPPPPAASNSLRFSRLASPLAPLGFLSVTLALRLYHPRRTNISKLTPPFVPLEQLVERSGA